MLTPVANCKQPLPKITPQKNEQNGESRIVLVLLDKQKCTGLTALKLPKNAYAKQDGAGNAKNG